MAARCRFHAGENLLARRKSCGLWRFQGQVKMPTRWILFLVCFSLLMSGSCRENQPSHAPADATKLSIITTVAPITSIVENVVGDKADVAGIIPEGINSHTFEPIPSDSKLLSSADLIIFNGLDLETPTQKLAQANLRQGATSYSLGDKTINKDEYIFDFSFPKEQGHPNPHLWLNPQYAIRYAALVRDEVIRLDPKNRDAYEHNAAQFIQKAEALDEAIQAATQTIPPNNRRLLTYHDSWPYFARRYGLRVVAVVEEVAEVAPGPKYLASLRNTIRSEHVPVIFAEANHSLKAVRQLAADAEVRVAVLDTLESGQPSPEAYEQGMRENLKTLKNELAGYASPRAR